MLSNCIQCVLMLLAAVVVAGAWGNAATAAAPKEVLHYRLTKAQTLHLDDAKTAKSFDESLKQLGCRCELHSHAGHFDLTIHCPEWKAAEFPNHHAVTEWEKWLGSLGFETRHQH